jgi:hypothetical protein
MNPRRHPYPYRPRGRRGLRDVLARAVPRRIADLGIDVDYVVINLSRPRYIDDYISLAPTAG